MKRLIAIVGVALLAAALVSLLGVMTAAAATGPAISATPSPTAAGHTIAIAGISFPKRASGALTVAGKRIATFTTDSRGRFNASWAIPPTAATGAVTVKASAGFKTASAKLTITAAQTPAPTPTPSATPLPAGDYYVSMQGNDANDGRTAATAWRTFAAVRNDRIQPGALILVQAGGVWTETIKTYQNGLRFGVYGAGAKPKIVAPDGQYAFDGYWKSGLQIDGFEFTSATRHGAEYGIVFVGKNDYVFRNCIVHGADGGMFLARGVRGLVENSEFYDSNSSGASSSVSIGGYEGPDVPLASDVTTFRGNYLHDFGYRALGNWGTNILIESNRVERWSAAGQAGSTDQAPAGIYITSQFAGSVWVRNNTLVGTGVEWMGIWVDWGPGNQTIVEGNSVTNAGGCFFAESTNNVAFNGNTCAQITRVGVWWAGDAPSTGGHVTNNTFAGPQPSNGWIWIIAGASATASNNTYSQ